MVSVKEVEKLNERIEKINLERTKAKTRQEILQKKLDEELQEYKENFKVDLTGSSLKATKALIDAEVSKVTEVVEEEYNLKLKVVDAIERGDFAEANKLMGVTPEEEEIEEVGVSTEGIEVEEDDSETEKNSDGVWVSIPEALKDVLEEDEDTEEDDFGFSDLGDIEEDDEEEDTKEEVKSKETEASTGAKGFMAAVANASSSEESEPEEEKPVKKMISVKEAFEGLNVADLEVEDDDDEIDDDFGFGDILSGTKYED